MKKIEQGTKSGFRKVILGENPVAAKDAVRTTVTTCTVATNENIENSGVIAHGFDSATDFSGDTGGAK